MSDAASTGERANREDSLRRKAYCRFQDALLAGTLRPGQSVSQRELAEMLDISLGGLRELLPLLQSEGLLHVLPQRGIQIVVIDLRMIREAFQLRLAIEREAVVHAVLHAPDQIFLAQRERHAAILARSEHAITQEVLDEAQRIDTGFHHTLIGLTDNQMLANAYAPVATRIRLIRLDRIRLNPTVLTPAVIDHLDIIDAILERDRARAVEAIETHIENARRRALVV